MDKEKIHERQQMIIGLIREFCTAKLDDEYFMLAEKLTQKLGRKRNVPFIAGKAEVWAAAIIHTLGTINFLFDKSSEPYVSVSEINDFFGTSVSTTGNRSKEIRDMFKLGYYDREFSLKKMQKKNPFEKLVMVDGFIVPLD